MKHANDNTIGEPLHFLSVCSGIEAASVAWHPLGWRPVAFSEIEKFPSAVLAHHYPDVPNLGDFTKIDTTTLGQVDILCGGTPCQAFSVAGLRQSLDDARGNLSLEFVRLAHELAAGNGLRNVVWENVVGVLSTKDNAFGCFLAGLVGADTPIEPPTRGKWGGAGLVAGPKGRAAWRVVDAQYFGVAQRRRRVLVVADFGNGADPAQVLFELEGVQRHSPPSREAGQNVAPTISARTKGGGGLGTDFDLDGGVIEHCADVAPTLRAGGNSTGGDRPYGTDVDTADSLIAYAPEIARCDATREGSSQDYETTTMVAAYRIAGDGAAYDEGNVTAPLTTGTDPSANVIAFDTTQVTSPLNRSVPKAGDPCHPLSAGAHPPAIAWSIMPQNSGKDYKARQVDVAQPLMAVALRGREGGATADLGGEVATALRASSGGCDKPHVLTHAFDARQSDVLQYGDITGPMDTGTPGPSALIGSAVRRLTPTECERLQGFPDGYTDIPWRGKPTSPDGPRYKALGNSWAVPKFVWLGRRIAMHMPTKEALRNAA